MKLQSGEVEGFLRAPPDRITLALLYGQDSGLVTLRARRLLAAVVQDPGDPFRVTDLDATTIDQPAARLVEEACALSLVGGRRVVRVRNAGDRLTAACKEVLAVTGLECLLVLEADELPRRSSLRQLAEQAPAAVALPCYHDDARSLPRVVRGLLDDEGLTIERDAFDDLVQHLGGDRSLTTAEITKLALYMADRPAAPVTRRDVAAVVGDSSALRQDEVVVAALGGEGAALDRALDRILAEGADPGSILRGCARTLLQALRLKAEQARGKPLQAVLGGLFFQRRDLMQRLIQTWSVERLVRALGILQAAETRCRLSRGIDADVCRRALAGLADQADARRS